MAFRVVRPDVQSVDHGEEDLVVYADGTPLESERAEILDSAL